jgi:hypothetical protein
MTGYTLTITDRIALLEEARALEQAGGTWRVRHVMAVLDCSRASVYRCTWIMKRRIKRGEKRKSHIGFHPSDVRLYQAMQSGRNPIQKAG